MKRPDVERIRKEYQENIDSRAPRAPEGGFAMYVHPLEVIALCDWIKELEDAVHP